MADVTLAKCLSMISSSTLKADRLSGRFKTKLSSFATNWFKYKSVVQIDTNYSYKFFYQNLLIWVLTKLFVKEPPS